VYGPTETTVWTSAKLLVGDGPITIGASIPGVTYYLVTESGGEPALGELGELCISEAVVVPLDGGVSRTLAAMLTPASADVDAVWAQAAKRLPRYMMPSTVVAVVALPLSPAGKADRKAIEALLREHIAATAHEPLGLPVHDGRALDRRAHRPRCWRATRPWGGIARDSRLTAEIACRYGVRLDLSDVVTVPSLRHLADLIRQHRP
jgi:hypothetical protein